MISLFCIIVGTIFLIWILQIYYISLDIKYSEKKLLSLEEEFKQSQLRIEKYEQELILLNKEARLQTIKCDIYNLVEKYLKNTLFMFTEGEMIEFIENIMESVGENSNEKSI